MKQVYHLNAFRTSSPQITTLNEDEVFVFGSNLAGRHGGGAAHLALKSFGAIYGQAIGLQGQSYGIPTKNAKITRTLALSTIAKHVDTFLEYAAANPDKKFLVTEIGCGLAGLDPKDVGPLFQAATQMENVYLPSRFLISIIYSLNP